MGTNARYLDTLSSHLEKPRGATFTISMCISMGYAGSQNEKSVTITCHQASISWDEKVGAN